MKFSLRFATILLGSLFVLPLHAADVDPLWAKVVAQAEEGKKWIAKDVEMSIEGNAEGKDVNRKFHMQLTGWEKDKPVYKMISMEPPEAPGKAGSKQGDNQIDKFSSLSDAFIKIDKPLKRKDGQQLDGKAATLFVIEESDWPMTTKVQVWVDPASANILRIKTRAHATLMVELELDMAYRAVANGISMPSKSDLKVEVLVPFKGAKMNLSNTNSNWVQRPL